MLPFRRARHRPPASALACDFTQTDQCQNRGEPAQRNQRSAEPARHREERNQVIAQPGEVAELCRRQQEVIGPVADQVLVARRAASEQRSSRQRSSQARLATVSEAARKARCGRVSQCGVKQNRGTDSAEYDTSPDANTTRSLRRQPPVRTPPQQSRFFLQATPERRTASNRDGNGRVSLRTAYIRPRSSPTAAENAKSVTATSAAFAEASSRRATHANPNSPARLCRERNSTGTPIPLRRKAEMTAFTASKNPTGAPGYSRVGSSNSRRACD